MNTTRRITATALASIALVAPSALATTAVAAKPTKPAHPATGQTAQLLKDIAGKDARMARLSTGNAVAALSDDTEAEVVARVGEARTILADLRAGVEAADSTVDTRAARKELHSFRVENFRIVVTILSKVERMEEAAATDPATDPATVTDLAAAEAAALEITATSTKADIRAVRELLKTAEAESATETETEGATA